MPTLRVISAADRPVLLLDGEELIGAKQNRVLNTTVLVAAHARLTVPVSCVEQGRWAYASRRFAAGDSSLYASVRARKAEHVTRSLRATGQHASDQGDIWQRLSLKDAEHEVRSDTGDGRRPRRAGAPPRPGGRARVPR